MYQNLGLCRNKFVQAVFRCRSWSKPRFSKWSRSRYFLPGAVKNGSAPQHWCYHSVVDLKLLLGPWSITYPGADELPAPVGSEKHVVSLSYKFHTGRYRYLPNYDVFVVLAADPQKQFPPYPPAQVGFFV